MKYEITIRELVPFTEEEQKTSQRNDMRNPNYPSNRYSDIPVHETRILHAMVTKEEFEAVKKAIIGIM